MTAEVWIDQSADRSITVRVASFDRPLTFCLHLVFLIFASGGALLIR
jgi:hypothetical protein